ncbi:VPLPA-CTERM-specific exosortase XrtD, partial [Candidatus Pacearchaeota archaeon]|nr:VPLPA-CTERM-specific exosortase XrtD [Candidatus Pacearchaeota archaeon]
MNGKTDQDKILWKMSAMSMVLIVGAILLLIFTFSSGLEQMVLRWETSEEYGYGYLIPVIALFFIWQKKNELAEKEFTGSWLGVLCVVLGAMLLVFGELAALYVVTQYAFIVTIFGLLLSLLGWRAMKVIIAPVLLLFFMVPLPNFLYQGMSTELQLISSSLGVWVIRLFGISVFLEGNVIDLGVYKLQVVEACSGLRYLFPLASLAYMAAYIFKGAWWKKAVLFVSSAPITVLMNSFRIGMIGVIVEYWGIGTAEGFLHDFEGWFIFMACMLLLVGEMWLLARIGKNAVSFADAFELSWPDELTGKDFKNRAISSAFKIVLPVVAVVSLVPVFIEEREEIVPDRKEFAGFLMEYPGWYGRRELMEQHYIDSLKFDDYIMSNYVSNEGDRVNFYV